MDSVHNLQASIIDIDDVYARVPMKGLCCIVNCSQASLPGLHQGPGVQFLTTPRLLPQPNHEPQRRALIPGVHAGACEGKDLAGPKCRISLQPGCLSIQHFSFLIPRTNQDIVETRNLKYWVLGPS